ncbi:hypothetical protein TcCL_ESM11044 [Trypanosoma cruzi]|nr:hypothetical protein TcCL_ESM11044 [Trypanosoma cruzi]
MGTIVALHRTDEAEAAVFVGVVPIGRKELEKLPHPTSCPDCGRPFDERTRSRRCRICGEALCKQCCRRCRNWKRRPLCDYCMDSCLHDYYRRTNDESFAAAHQHEHHLRQRVKKKTASGGFLRGFFLTAMDGEDFLHASKPQGRVERNISQGT